ncbi:MAG: A24 family peptidase [Pirellulaceae bacterium]|nr:A24 family peptidase [Pirellulaceae bacterium]
MDIVEGLVSVMLANWPVWFVTITLIVAAVIDGFQLRVPNSITFPMIISGWVFSAAAGYVGGFEWCEGLAWYQCLGYSLLGSIVGLLLLLPAYAIGGMGAGDVKLMAGIGAWMHCTTTIYSFGISAVIGAILAVGMAFYVRGFKKHSTQFFSIFNEIMTIKDPVALSEIAAERKPTMLLLPYGIPIAMGTIGYFIVNGMLV